MSMKVHELIERLAALPADADVVVDAANDGPYEVSRIEQYDAGGHVYIFIKADD